MGEQEIETRPEVSTQAQSAVEGAKADTLCYGIPGQNVWYCATCQQLLSSPATPHAKPVRAEKKKEEDPLTNRATRRAYQRALHTFLRLKQRAAHQ